MKISDYIGEATAYDKKLELERKEPLSWLKSVSAFANTLGGVLIYGVSDDGHLVGLAHAEKDAEDVSEIIKNQLDPVPEFELSFHVEDGKKFLIVSVKSGDETPYYVLVKGHRDAYVRVGNESVKANAITLKRLVLRGARLTWDALMSVSGDAEIGAGGGLEGDRNWIEPSMKTGMKTTERILALLKDNPELSIDAIASSLGKARSTIIEAIGKLKKDGRLMRVGPDKGGHWEVALGNGITTKIV